MSVSVAPSIHVDFSAVDSRNCLQPYSSPISRNSSIGSSFSGSSISSLSHSDKSPPTRTSPLPPLSRFFPSRYTSLDESSHQSLMRNFADYDHSHDDTSAEETPRPDHATPRVLTTAQGSTPSFVSVEGLPSDKLSLNAPLSLSIGMFPTPFASRAGSEYEPSPLPLLRPHPNPRRPSRELHLMPTTNTKSLHPGSIISANEDNPSVSLTLLRTLGQGSFSSVWLACDVSGTLEQLVLSRKASIKRLKSAASDGVVRRKSSRRSTGRPNVSGTKPWRIAGSPPSSVANTSPITNVFDRPDSNEPDGRLVAVKLTDRAIDDRTRVSFIREVEVLRVCHRILVVSFGED
jgi:protein-serine/threonine kinase